ncbi:dihydrofolate reductase family protein [Acaricomes phytoseiuli]|uniref:dihydrofolate reductase family protein n=1 Tax=Acaricomes phytoseiuli TaxID=291968 RepID=UPI0003722930|nr:dihydrofolate reductase family protein [Acaricomes phytoseiuli]MCW1249089.1 dihydrofolate reductase family protein [Acaricomes phytoseiuli]
MSRTVYYTSMSIDGFLATEDHNLDWLFSLQGYDMELYQQFYAGIGAQIMGAQTYRFLQRAAAAAADPAEQAWPYPDRPSWVFSHGELTEAGGLWEQEAEQGRIIRAEGDVRTAHAQATAAAEEQDVWVVGGGDLAAQFHAAGLLDELYLTIVPFILGSGQRLLPLANPTQQLPLISQQLRGGGVIEARYALR